MSFLQSRTGSARQGIGKPVLRKEDARLLIGRGCYSDDVNFPGQAYACFVRSPHAHASIGRIDTAAARATPGVIAVLTGVDAVADGVKPLAHSPMPGNPYEEIIRKEDVRFIAPHPGAAIPAGAPKLGGCRDDGGPPCVLGGLGAPAPRERYPRSARYVWAPHGVPITRGRPRRTGSISS